MQDKLQKAVIYSVVALIAIILMIVVANFLNRDPGQEKLNSMLINTQTLISAVEAVNENSLTFSERTWAATAKQSLLTDLNSLESKGAFVPEGVNTSIEEQPSSEDFLSSADTLLEENISLYHQLDEERQKALSDLLTNQELLLKEVRKFN